MLTLFRLRLPGSVLTAAGAVPGGARPAAAKARKIPFAKGSASHAAPLFIGAAGFTTVMPMVPGFMSGFNAIPEEAVRTMLNGNPIVGGFVTLASLVGMLTTWNAAFMAGCRDRCRVSWFCCLCV